MRIHQEMKNSTNSPKVQQMWTGSAELLERVETGRYRVYTHKGEQILESVRLKPYHPPFGGRQPQLHFYTEAKEKVEPDRYIVKQFPDHKPEGTDTNGGPNGLSSIKDIRR